MNLHWSTIVEIGILWFVIYHILLFFEGTRALQVLRGIIFLLVAFFLFQLLDLQVLDWLLTKLFGISVIGILIIFHPEIRQGLARLGQRHLFGTVLREEELDFIASELGKATEYLCRDKKGGLLAIERTDPLTAYIETGVNIDSRLSADLVQTIFSSNNLLHDGGIIIQHGRIVAAGCIFPLTQNTDLNRVFGTRHRAALGLSEETDAVVIVISEERHDVSLVHNGRIYKDLGNEELISRVKDILKTKNA